MSEKTPNYSAEMVDFMESVYNPKSSQEEREAQIAAIVAETGKTAASVRAKLSHMGLYVPKVYKTKTGGTVVKKEQIVQALEAKLGASLNGIEKATKNTLVIIWNALNAEETETEES